MRNQINAIVAVVISIAITSCSTSDTKTSVQESAPMKMTTEIPEGIVTPNVLNSSSLGELKFFDGVPYPETESKVYDYLDLHNAIDAFLRGIHIHACCVQNRFLMKILNSC